MFVYTKYNVNRLTWLTQHVREFISAKISDTSDHCVKDYQWALNIVQYVSYAKWGAYNGTWAASTPITKASLAKSMLLKYDNSLLPLHVHNYEYVECDIDYV